MKVVVVLVALVGGMASLPAFRSRTVFSTFAGPSCGALACCVSTFVAALAAVGDGAGAGRLRCGREDLYSIGGKQGCAAFECATQETNTAHTSLRRANTSTAAASVPGGRKVLIRSTYPRMGRACGQRNLRCSGPSCGS